MRAATDVPLEMMRACRHALREAPIVAAHSIRSTRGDVGVAIELLRSAVRSAGLTIDANLASLKDAEYASVVKTRTSCAWMHESAADADYGLSLVSGKLRLSRIGTLLSIRRIGLIVGRSTRPTPCPR